MKYFLAISAFTPVFVLLSSLTITAGAESFADTLVLNLSQKCRTALINLNTDATLSECTGNGDQLALFTQTGNILPDLLDFFNSVYCNRDCGPSIPKILKSISEECADDMDYNDGYNLVRGFTNYYSNYYGYRNMFCMRESNNASSNCGLSYVQKISEITGLVPNVTNAVYFVVNTTLQEKLSQIFTDNSTFLCNDCNKAMFTVMKYGPAAMSGSGWEGSVLSTLPPKVCGPNFVDARISYTIINMTSNRSADVLGPIQSPNSATRWSRHSHFSALILLSSALGLLLTGFAVIL